MATGGTTIGGVTSTGGDETGEPLPEPAVGPCEELDVESIQGEYIASEPVTRTFKPRWVCPEAEWPGIDPTVNVYVTHPDPMPSGVALPVVVFVPGANQSAAAYDHIHDQLASDGAIVLSVGATGGDSVQLRAQYLACAARWLRWENPPMSDPTNQGRPSAISAENIACGGLTLGGHSRGGQASYLVTNERDTAPYSDLLDGYEVAALFNIAPLFEGSGPPGGYTPMNPTTAPPFLVLSTASDEDTKGDGTTRFDTFLPEYQFLRADGVQQPACSLSHRDPQPIAQRLWWWRGPNSDS